MAKNNEKFVSRENAKTLWGYMVDLLTGKYTKPSGGIPKSDLESSVQTSLGKADSALQSFTETDPTVPSWAKATNKPSYTQDEVGDGTTYKRVNQTEKNTWNAKGTYSKPSGGIPKSDLASAVQTSLEKADSALQSYTETDPTVPSWAKQSSKPSYNSDEISDTNRTHKFATAAQLQQISMNQTNILYAINTGVKNALVIKDRETDGAGTIHFSAKDGIVTVTGTNGSNTSFFTVNFTGISGRFKLNGCPSGGSDNTYLQRIYTADGSIAIGIDRGSGTAEFTLNPNVEYQWTIRIQANYAIQNSLVFKPMLYQADTDGSTFQTGALPNYDLTRLQSEDRAGLIDVVDSGAKNILNISNATFGDRSKVTFNSDGSVTGAITDDTRYWSWANSEFKFTLPAGSYVLYCVVTSGTNANWGVALRKSDNSEVAVVNSYTGKDFVEFTLTSATEVGFMGKIFDRRMYVMICTKAAFGVSPKFVPYRVPINGVYAHDVLVACSTTLTTTGIKFTATEKAAYRITATAIYYNSIPLKLVIKYKTNSSANQLPFCTATHADGDDVSLIASGIMSLDVGGEFEVFAQYASSTSNYFYVLVEKIG